MANIIDALLITLGMDTKGVKAGADETKKALKDTQDSSKKTASEIENSSKKMTEAYRKVRNEVLGLFALVSAGRGIKQMVGDITGSDAALGRFSKQINMSTEELSAWQQAVIRVGGSAEGFAGTAQKLTNAYEQQGLTGINPLVQYYRALNIEMVDSQGKMKPVTQQLREMSQYVQDKKMSGPQASAFFGNMGIDQGTINLLLEGPKAVDALIKRMEALGTVHEKDAKNAQELKKNLDDLKQGFDSLVRTVINDLSPMVIKIMTEMSNWLTVNRQWLAQKIDDYLKAFMEVVVQAPGQIKAFKESIDPVVEALGGWVKVTEVLFGLWAGAKVLGMVASISKVGAAIFAAKATSAAAPAVAEGAGIGLMGLLAEALPWVAAALVMKPSPANAGEDELVKRRKAEGWVGAQGNNNLTGFNEVEKDDLYRRFLQFQESFNKALEDATKMKMNDNDLRVADNALGAGGYSGGLGNERHPNTGARINTNQAAKDAYQFWIAKGFTPEGAAAMVAGENTESGFNPAARGDYVNGQPTAFGAFQWHGDRAWKILNKTGIDVRTASAEQQREAMYQEMKRGLDPQSGAAFPLIRDARDARVAGAIHSSQVERPADRMGNMIRRGNDAQQYRNTFGRPGALEGFGPVPMAVTRPLPGPRRMDLNEPQNNNTTNIGDVHIHTRATDADGIAADANRALQRRITPIQTNTGLR